MRLRACIVRAAMSLIIKSCDLAAFLRCALLPFPPFFFYVCS